MKTYKKITAICILLCSCIISFANPVERIYDSGDDTLKVVWDDNINKVELKIIVNDSAEIINTKEAINVIVENLNDIFEKIELNEIPIDTTLNIIILKEDDDTILIIDDIEYDDLGYTEIDEYVYDDSEYTYDEDYEKYWEDYSKKKKNFKFVSHRAYFDFGFNNYLENGSFPSDNKAQYAVKNFGSWNVAFGGIVRLRPARVFSMDLGYGFSWYNFKYQDKATVVTEGENMVEFSTRGEPGNYVKSKTTVPYVNLSFTPMFHISKSDGSNNFKMRIGAGIYAGYRIGGKVKYVFDGSKSKHKGNYFLSSYRYGIKGLIGFGNGFDIYATYDLNTLYAENRGPKLNPICFGISLTF